jgi:hypothetical protein
MGPPLRRWLKPAANRKTAKGRTHGSAPTAPLAPALSPCKRVERGIEEPRLEAGATKKGRPAGSPLRKRQNWLLTTAP